MLHPKMKYVYVGIDSHKDTHCAVILNCFFEKLGEITFPNAPSEFVRFFDEVVKFNLEGTKPAFGLEDVSAYGRSLAAFLKDRKQVVKHVNAALVASERKSRNVLHKTDSEDAQCAARVLLSRFDSLPDADPQDKYWVLQNLVTRRRGIVKMNTALKNQLHAFITSHYPSYNKFFAVIDSKTALLFFEKYPSPSMLKKVSVEDLTVLLEENSNKRLRSAKAEQILACIKKDGDTTSDYQEARDMAVRSIIMQLNNNLVEIKSIDVILEGFLDRFDFDLRSMKGIDTVMAANLIAEIGDIQKFPSPAKLARYSGVAPVTYSSGKTDLQFSNERGNRVLNSLFFHLAVSVTMYVGPKKRILNPFFHDYYHRKITEGKTKRQALKCVQRRLVNIIWGMMKNRVDYINPPTQLPDEGKESDTEEQTE